MLPSLQSVGGGGCNLLWGVFVAGTLACNLLADGDVILPFSLEEILAMQVRASRRCLRSEEPQTRFLPVLSGAIG